MSRSVSKARVKLSEEKKVNDGNLIPNSERSPSELREMGRKGGIKSGGVRRRNKRLRENATILAEIIAESEEGKKLITDLKKQLRGP